jgi:hypothetical protein
MSESSWSAEYQGHPFLVGSGEIPIEKLKVVPFFDRREISTTVMSVDKAGTEGGDGAQTAIVIMHKMKNGTFVLENIISGHWGAHQGSETGFQKGHPRFGGRRKGSRNKFGGDLREAVVAGIAATGFIEKAEDGSLQATGRGGVQGFIEWLALHEPKTAAALLARVIPYFISTDGDTPDVASEAEIEVMLKELGLPLGLIEHMRAQGWPQGQCG